MENEVDKGLFSCVGGAEGKVRMNILLAYWVVFSFLCSPSYAFVVHSLAPGAKRMGTTSLFDGPAECGVCPTAPKCSGAYLSKGCQGNGRIQGGIGVYLSWWPIKVFRPCPAFSEAGYTYRREGQTLEQVLFGEPSEKMKERMERIKNEEMKRKAASSALGAENEAMNRSEEKADS
jgi:hypothetical protein